MKRRYIKYYNMKGFESDMIVYGWDLMLFMDDTGESPSGWRIFGKKDGQTREIFIAGNSRGYFRVLFPFKKGEQQRECPLHKLIYAYYCGWRSLDIMAGQNIHHIDRNKKNNDIENLVALTAKEHTVVHYLDALTARGVEITQEIFDEYQERSKKILLRACAIKENTIKARGRVVKKVSDIIWED